MTPKQLHLNGVNGHADAASRVGHAAFAAILTARKGDPGFRLTEQALIDALRPALAKEVPAARRVDKRNPLFDALAGGCGYADPVTRAAAGTVAAALRDILEVDPTVTAEQLKAVAVAVVRRFPDAGPMAVAGRWHEYASLRRKQRQKADEPDAPKGWLDTLNRLFPECVMARGQPFEIKHETAYEWFQLDASLRRQIEGASA